MLQSEIKAVRYPGSIQLSLDELSRGIVFDLLMNVRDALASDLSQARHCLDRLTSLFGEIDQVAPLEGVLLPVPRSPQADEASPRGGLAPWQLKRVFAYMNANLTEPLKLHVLADIAQLSRNHFSRAFKASMGEAPHSFLLRLRIRCAQTLLLTTDEPLSQIAHGAGFADQSHMTRLFGKLVGETPSRWRRSRQVGIGTPRDVMSRIDLTSVTRRLQSRGAASGD